MKTNKYLYGWCIQTNHGYGWDEECWEDTWREARQQLKCYRENAFGRFSVRAVKGREPNPAYIVKQGEKL